MSVRLRKGNISILEVLILSRAEYKGKVDNKMIREKLDVVGGKIVARRGLTYNKATKKWEQTSREVRLDFIVSSRPISYEKTDTVATHRYPVIFLIKDWDKGMKSSFRWRTGGLKKWKNGKKNKRNISEGKTEKEKDEIRIEKAKNARENLKITNMNIKNGLQGHFIFSLMWVLKQYDLLFGPLTCKNVAPKKYSGKEKWKNRNPELIPYFDKTALYLALRILPRIFKNPKLNQIFGRPSIIK